mgnify:CR=1 FL=1
MVVPPNPWSAFWQRLPVPLRNRYYLTLLIFFFILIFLDKNNLWTQWKLMRAKHRLQQDKALYQEKIKEAKEQAETFELTKERYARERYYMRRPGEDVYIIQEAK